jgi:hypothetical protein
MLVAVRRVGSQLGIGQGSAHDVLVNVVVSMRNLELKERNRKLFK